MCVLASTFLFRSGDSVDRGDRRAEGIVRRVGGAVRRVGGAVRCAADAAHARSIARAVDAVCAVSAACGGVAVRCRVSAHGEAGSVAAEFAMLATLVAGTTLGVAAVIGASVEHPLEALTAVVDGLAGTGG